MTPEQVQAAIDAARTDALTHAAAEAANRYREMELEAERPTRKHEAILRIMQEPNAVNGKPHSYSSAEAISEMDPEYAALLAVQRDVIRAGILTRAKHWDARTRAATGVAILTTMGATL